MRHRVILGFCGDVMLGRMVDAALERHPVAYPWGNVLPLLQETDFNVINLETTLTTSWDEVPKVFNFKADPKRVEALKLANVRVANLANNHILDYDIKGLKETIEVLDQHDILRMGAGINATEAHRAVCVEREGISFGYLGYTDNEPGWKAGSTSPGTAYLEVGDIDTVKQDLEKLNTDISIVSIHWGPNMRQKPPKSFIDFAHALVDAGVTLVHGHSAHIFQGVEQYRNGLIFYDTGDFVDDYMVDPELRNDRSFFFKVYFDRSGVQRVEMIPVLISNCQVNLAPPLDAQEACMRMQALSKDFGTVLSLQDHKLFIE